jgi:hypothetical protein
MKKVIHWIKSLRHAHNCLYYISERSGMRYGGTPEGEPAGMPELLDKIDGVMKRMRLIQVNFLLLGIVSLSGGLFFWLAPWGSLPALDIAIFLTVGAFALLLGGFLSVSFWWLTLIFTLRILRKSGIEFFPFKKR